jgi:hypothetical protein
MIWTQVEMHFSLISATIPVLRPVIMNLSTNYSSLGPKESSSGYGNSAGTYKLSTLKTSSYIVGNDRTLREDNLSDSVHSKAFPSSSVHNRNSPRTESIESHSSEQMIIRKQISWRVERGEVGSTE